MTRAYAKNFLNGFSILILSGFAISCTKEVPYKSQYKEEVQSKSVIDEKAEYIYVASSDLTNRDDTGASGASPYWQGSESIVRFRFTENTLQAVKVEDESRLKDNKTNESVVFEIPIQHLDYRCAEDRYGKCTNQEEENREIPWNKKTQFKANYDGMRTIGLNLLPIEMDQVFGTSCFTESSSRFVKADLTADALNIQVEKTFKGDLTCLDNKGIQIQSLRDLQSQIIYHYSFAKLNKLASADYKALNYSNSDQNSFGFFTTDQRKYDAAFNRLEKNKTQMMNRWNPARKEIDYFLTDNFDKPEFAAIKKATQTAFDRVNQGLKDAGVDLKLNLKGTDHKSPGDIRNSMIVLVEDPIISGPLGYGPSVSNPRTGEIMSARVAMYYGNLLSGIKMTYDEVVRELRRQQKGSAKDQTPITMANAKVTPSEEIQQQNAQKKQAARANFKTLWEKAALVKEKQKARQEKQPAANAFTTHNMTRSTSELAHMSQHDFNRATLLTDKNNTAQDALAAMSKHCNYPSELFPFNEAIKTALQDKLGQDLKLWKDLNDVEKNEAIALIAPEIWVPTLVHELGHNLGLRHNFAGSEDKANFFNAEELAKIGVNHQVPYSSVMDYGYSELNVLPTLGKYDIAALRFGYGRQVEDSTGGMIDIKENQSLRDIKADKIKLRDYDFCTDEHVDANPNCKRFDQGTNNTEIVDFLIKSYDDMYTVRNFRNGRENFSKFSDAAYASGVRARFQHIRAFMERYQSVKAQYRLSDDSPEWEKTDFMKDIKQAAVKSGQFFLSVLQTPDIYCAVATKEKPNEIHQLTELNTIGTGFTSCFDVEMKEGFIMIGQAGKAFNSKKDNNSENNYADQIDVRGIYVDKLIAVEKLFSRRTGTIANQYTEGSYVDMTMLFGDIMNTMQALLLNESTPTVMFRDERGNKLGRFEINQRIFSAPSEADTMPLAHWIETPVSEDVAKYLGLPMSRISFQQAMLNIMGKKLNVSQSHATADRDFMDMFTIVKTSKSYQLNPDVKGIKYDLGTTRMLALKDNAFAWMALKNLENYKSLLGLEDEKLKNLYFHLRAKKEQVQISSGSAAPAEKLEGYTDEQLALPAETVIAFARKELNGPLFEYLATILPASNAQ